MTWQTRRQEPLMRRSLIPDGATYKYDYGDRNELKQVSLPGVGAITYPSYTWTRPDRVSYPGGGTRTYTYDPLMRLRRLLARDPGGNALLDVQYQYDRRNNILTKTTPQGTVNYTYDAISRLTGVQVETPTAGQPDEGFTYDKVGNRTTEEGIEGEWHYNANNELLTFANTAYTYDANGNTTQVTLDGTVLFSYHYNTFDRLVQVDDVNGEALGRYYYDPFGRRLWKQAGDETTLFFYSDEGLIAEYDASGYELRSYGYRPNSLWTTNPLFLKQENEYFFYQNDHLGTPQKLVKMNGAIAWSADYTAFGKAGIEIEAVTNNLRFPGQYYDKETGLHYNWFRYYNSKIGRYLKVDPIGLKGGLNLFAYTENSPLKYLDPQGLACGSGWTDYIVPDTPLSNIFTYCCQEHDDCYAGFFNACNKTQFICDFEFLLCMQKRCKDYPYKKITPTMYHEGEIQLTYNEVNVDVSQTCMDLATIYHFAVTWLGGGAFSDSRKRPPCGECDVYYPPFKLEDPEPEDICLTYSGGCFLKAPTLPKRPLEWHLEPSRNNP